MRYVELAQELRSRIASGAYAHGDCIESEAELCRACGVSRTTVRNALELLRRDGLVSSRKGSGWFVTVRPHHQAVGPWPVAEHAVAAFGATPSRRVLEYVFEAASRPVSETLGLARAGEVLRVTVLTAADGEPFVLQTVWMPGEVGSPISRAAFAESPIVELLGTVGVRLGSGSQTITAGLASRHLELLGVRRGAAVLICRGLVRDLDGRPLFVYEDSYRGDRMAFDVEFSEPTGTPTNPPIDVRLQLARWQ
jgi:GntR family transcriptional regulator